MQVHIFHPYFVALLVLAPLFIYWLRRTPRHLSPLRRRLLLGLRLAVFVLLIAGLVRFSLARAYSQANVIFLLDMSHSIAAEVRQQALTFIQTLSKLKRPDDGVGLIVFGADASLEQAVSKTFTVPEIASEVDGAATNIARALQVGLASFPSEGARQLVLLTDTHGHDGIDAAASRPGEKHEHLGRLQQAL